MSASDRKQEEPHVTVLRRALAASVFALVAAAPAAAQVAFNRELAKKISEQGGAGLKAVTLVVLAGVLMMALMVRRGRGEAE